ncbi:sensor histidine kinase [Streptantibioticus ferralitis]|uniref:ATP-binding protein n=1 Tax=Streptantibioticus ferralitis TaxID=236510 RepID=A0ABT5YU84_9ACTN|nr:ATP-binding protein [Streptantibioticus ferralitis]MDF2255177.1 ATP-binding protein [Streptantibioticus ferralitis]
MYCAAQELLDNVVRHSGATHAHVTLVCDTGTLRLTVTDDGVGTDRAHLRQRLSAGHIGSASQRVRVEAAGGRMEHLPTDDGTRIRITVPLPHSSVPAARNSTR